MTFLKTTICALAIILGVSAANAQQLPNADFETWVDCIPWNSSNTTTVQGTTPEGWCVSNVVTPSMSAGNQTVAENVSGDNSTSAVKVLNKSTVGQVIPGYVTLGTTWATARVKLSTPSDADGGTWGGLENFTYQPDAIAFDYIRTQGSGSTQPASVIAYIWKGETSQAEVPANNVWSISNPGAATTVTMINRDRNILDMATSLGGAVTKSADFELISTINHSITEANTEWASIELPFKYASDATPQNINVIFSAGDYFADRSVHKANDALTVDNVRMVYFSRLSSLTVNGTAVSGFDSAVYSYTSELPYSTDIKVEGTVLGRTATHTVAFDDANHTATVTVSNVDADSDGATSHAYVISFAEPQVTEIPVAVQSAEYKGSISIDLGQVITLENQTVQISATGEGTCNFALDHFSLDGQSDMGNIRVNDVRTFKTEGSDLIHYAGSATGITLNMDGTDIFADVDLEGTEDAEHNLTMDIHVKWLMGDKDDHENFMPIEVKFNGTIFKDDTSGITDIEAENDETARYFLINGVEVNDATAPGLYIVRRGNKTEKLIVK